MLSETVRSARVADSEEWHPIRGRGQRRTPGMSQPDTMFASRSVPRHLVRGALGLPMMVAAFALVPWLGPLTLLLVVPAAVLLRGCPTCWALGLVQTRALGSTCELRSPSEEVSTSESRATGARLAR